MIHAEELMKVYQMGDNEVRALDGASFTIEKGEMIAIMGPSGSGKSTLMSIIGCLDMPSSGKYSLDGESVESLDETQLANVRGHKIGFVFQQFNLLARTSALENVMLPLTYAGYSGKEREERARKALERVGLGDRTHHAPNELSGGQQQRVAIARALIHNPAVVLADEPTASLDTERAYQVVETFANLIHENGRAGVIVTHDLRMCQYVDRVLQMQDGKLVREYNDKKEILELARGTIH